MAEIRSGKWKGNNLSNYYSGDPLAIIYNEGLWRINYVTPLFNLQYTKVKLKNYSTKLKQAIVSISQACTSNYKVDIQEIPNMKYSEEDSSALFITVTAANILTSKTVYMALLLSWGLTETLDQTTHLPYMLEHGERKIGNAIKPVMQTLFDCNIRPVAFTQMQLLQFGFYLSGIDTSRGTDPFTFVFRTPQAEAKDKLSISFDLGDIQLIWNGLKEDSNNTNPVKVCYDLLQNQIFDSLGIDLIVCDLFEINLPKAEVKHNGTVKMKTPDMVNCVFTILNEIIHSSNHLLLDNMIH